MQKQSINLYCNKSVPYKHLILAINIFCLIGLLCFVGMVQASVHNCTLLNTAQQTRVALIFGNKDYHSNRLDNPINDANMLSEVFVKMDYAVMLCLNAKRLQMEEALFTFGRKAELADTAVIYYAGHAIQVGGNNYLLPIGFPAPLNETRKLKKLIKLDELLDEVSYAKKFSLVMLDACRDNPFADALRDRTGRSIKGRGLARVSASAQTLISYATQEDDIAEDGRGQRHSPYALALEQYLPQHIDVRLLFGKVYDKVNQLTNYRQKPATYASLGGEPIYLSATTVSMDYIESVNQQKMIYIKGGTFEMGCHANAGQCDNDEKPAHRVSVAAFWMAEHEVTNQQFVQFLNENGRSSDKKRPWFETQSEDSTSKIKLQQNIYRVTSGYAQHPVNNVSWYGAVAYAKWLVTKTGKHYRLPTEAQWEYAARKGGKNIAYPWGNQAPICQAGAYNGAKFDDDKQCDDNGTVAVKSYQAHAGLFDMAGNLREWTCSNWAGYDSNDHRSCNNDVKEDSYRVIRGGSWYNIPRYVRSAYRNDRWPSKRYSDIGFRLVQDPNP